MKEQDSALAVARTDVVDGRPVPWPVEDPEHLDDRRESVGIESFAASAARYSAGS